MYVYAGRDRAGKALFLLWRGLVILTLLPQRYPCRGEFSFSWLMEEVLGTFFLGYISGTRRESPIWHEEFALAQMGEGMEQKLIEWC